MSNQIYMKTWEYSLLV